jgi:hypothetical protein
MPWGIFRVTWRWPTKTDTEFVDTVTLENVHDAEKAYNAIRTTPEWQQKQIVRVETFGASNEKPS